MTYEKKTVGLPERLAQAHVAFIAAQAREWVKTMTKPDPRIAELVSAAGRDANETGEYGGRDWREVVGIQPKERDSEYTRPSMTEQRHGMVSEDIGPDTRTHTRPGAADHPTTHEPPSTPERTPATDASDDPART